MSVKQSLNLKRKSKKRKVLPSLPSFWRVKRPGPSLHPPIPSPAMKMLGTDVLPVLSASSARKAIIDELVRNKQKREKGKKKKKEKEKFTFPLVAHVVQLQRCVFYPHVDQDLLGLLAEGSRGEAEHNHL